MVEESDRPGRERGEGPEGPSRRSEADLFAERRALRATESGEAALVRRAEAAEATVQTLERHVASLQQRLDGAEQERMRLAELLEAERTVAVEREHELRRVKQREYAEQQLRVEAEERLVGAESEGRADVEDLRARLGVSEREATELAARLQTLQRQLAESEQAASAERASAQRAGDETALRLDQLERRTAELQQRTAELQQRAADLQQRLERETAARERSEQLVESMRDGHRRVEAILDDVKGAVRRLGGALAARAPTPPPAYTPPAYAPPVHTPQPAVPPQAAPPAGTWPAAPPSAPPAGAGRAPEPPGERGNEMADALAAAVERLRARAEQAPPLPEDPEAPRAHDEPVRAAGEPSPKAAAAPAKAPSHKHSMSLLGRLRRRRRERRKKRQQR